jgi:hypothetical protein
MRSHLESKRRFLDSRPSRAIIDRLSADEQDAIRILIAANATAQYRGGISAAEAQKIANNEAGMFALDDDIFGMEGVLF